MDLWCVRKRGFCLSMVLLKGNLFLTWLLLYSFHSQTGCWGFDASSWWRRNGWGEMAGELMWVVIYLNGASALSICMQTRNGYWENCTVEMNSRPASVSALLSRPAFTKEESTVTSLLITTATLEFLKNINKSIVTFNWAGLTELHQVSSHGTSRLRGNT